MKSVIESFDSFKLHSTPTRELILEILGKCKLPNDNRYYKAADNQVRYYRNRKGPDYTISPLEASKLGGNINSLMQERLEVGSNHSKRELDDYEFEPNTQASSPLKRTYQNRVQNESPQPWNHNQRPRFGYRPNTYNNSICQQTYRFNREAQMEELL